MFLFSSNNNILVLPDIIIMLHGMANTNKWSICSRKKANHNTVYIVFAVLKFVFKSLMTVKFG